MAKDGLLRELALLGLARHNFGDESFRHFLTEQVGAPEGAASTRGVQLDLSREGAAERLRHELSTLPRPWIFYLALPPDQFGHTLNQLFQEGFLHGGARAIVEKPFGLSSTEAKRLTGLLREIEAREGPNKVLLADFYLQRPGVLNVLGCRTRHPELERLLGRDWVESVEVNLSEKAGVAGRGHTYDRIGAWKDVVQNHLLQLLAIACLDLPAHVTTESLPAARLRFLKELTPSQDLFRAQYQGYRNEEGTAPDSTTETYVLAPLSSRAARWRGVPFFLQAGKALARDDCSVRFRLSRLPPDLAARHRLKVGERAILTFNIWPEPGIALEQGARRLSFWDPAVPRHAPYRRLLLDALRGDTALFPTVEEALRCWELSSAIESEASGPPPLVGTYPPGSLMPLEGSYSSSKSGL